MFEYFVRPHVCLSVSPSKHRKKLYLCGWGIPFQVLGERNVGLSLDLCLGGGGSVSF